MLKAQSHASRGCLSATARTSELALWSRSAPIGIDATQSAAECGSLLAQLVATAPTAPLRVSPTGKDAAQVNASSGDCSPQARAIDSIAFPREPSGTRESRASQ